MEQGLFSSTTPFTPPTTEDGRLSWLRLIRSRRVGPSTFHRLMAEYGGAPQALDALPGIARAAGVRDYECCPEGAARAELAAARKAGAVMVCHGSPEYPPELGDLPDAPPLLWCVGDLSLLARPMVAMVGARNASSLGLRMARRLAAGLAEAGVAVVSGLARGIDAAAHEAALAGGTVAVQAGGVDVIYPSENADLAERIAGQGLRISEQPMGAAPQARHFPLRNRIVSGLALGVVVVEAAARSGSLITARTALDQGREVLAVPGHPVDARAAGCNQLIRDGSVLVRGPDDVLEALGPALAAAAETAGRSAAGAAGRAGPAARGASGAGVSAQAAAPDTGAQADIGARAAAATRPEGRNATGPQQAADGSAAPASSGGAGAAHRPRPAETDVPEGPPRRPLAGTAALHGAILDRLGPSPLAEDQLIRDLALPAARVAPELLALELDGRIQRQPGGLLARVS